jgi:AraC-like DNA-binding protein
MVERRTRPSERSVPGISRAVVNPVLDALLELGFDARREITAVEMTSDPILAGAAADLLLNTASVRLADEALGIHLAELIPIGGLGILDYAFCTSSTLRDALARVALHYNLVTQRVKLRLVESPPRATLVFDRLIPTAHSRHWLEFSFAFLGARVRQTTNQATAFEEVSFRHEAPRKTAVHDSFFGCRARFSQAEDRLGFHHALLDSPLRTASGSLAELLDAKMRELEPEELPDAFVDRVRQVTVALLDKRDVQLDSAATRLRVTRRTLQRELNRRGTSHKEILDEIRRERAAALLSQSLTLTEVAARLAYSEPSAFFRAFRRWTGTSPRASR